MSGQNLLRPSHSSLCKYGWNEFRMVISFQKSLHQKYEFSTSYTGITHILNLVGESLYTMPGMGPIQVSYAVVRMSDNIITCTFARYTYTRTNIRKPGDGTHH